MNKHEILIYELEALASNVAIDIGFPVIDVCYDNSETGAGHHQTVCLVDLGQRALDRLRELEQLEDEKIMLEALKLIKSSEIIFGKDKDKS